MAVGEVSLEHSSDIELHMNMIHLRCSVACSLLTSSKIGIGMVPCAKQYTTTEFTKPVISRVAQEEITYSDGHFKT